MKGETEGVTAGGTSLKDSLIPPRARVAVVLLGVVTFLALLARVPSVAEPLAIDQGLWASGAKGLSRGLMLYRDLWDHKPPGTFLAYCAAFSLLGWTPASIAWADILASVATALLLFTIVRRIGGITLGAATGALYATLTMPAWLYHHGGIGERAVAETFIVVLVALAVWCGTHLLRRLSVIFAAGVGLCIGAAAVFKPNAGVYLPALLLWIALFREKRDAGLPRAFAIAVLASLIPPAATLAWLWSRGVLPDAWVALVEFNRAYVGRGFAFGSYAIQFAKLVWLRIKTDPLWLAGAVGTLVAFWDCVRSRKLDPVSSLAVLWGGASALAIAANGARLFGTYFTQALAPLAVLAAWLLAAARQRSSVHRLAASAAAALMVLFLLGRQYPARVYDSASADVDRLRGRLDRAAYLQRFGGYADGRGYSARANDELAAFIRARTGRDDRIYLFGINGAGIYFAADRLPAHRFLRVNFFFPGDIPDPAFTLGSVTQRLAAVRPVYLIFERIYSPPTLRDALDNLRQQPEIIRLLQLYRFETQIEDFTLYRRMDGAHWQQD